MDISVKEIEHIANLSRITLTVDEKNTFAKTVNQYP